MHTLVHIHVLTRVFILQHCSREILHGSTGCPKKLGFETSKLSLEEVSKEKLFQRLNVKGLYLFSKLRRNT